MSKISIYAETDKTVLNFLKTLFNYRKQWDIYKTKMSLVTSRSIIIYI